MVSVNPALPPFEWRSSAFREARERHVRGRRGIVLAASAVTALAAAGGAAMMLAERAEVSPGAEGDRVAAPASPAAASAVELPPASDPAPTAALVLLPPVAMRAIPQAIPAPPPPRVTITPPPRATAFRMARPAQSQAQAPAPDPVVEAPAPVAIETPIGPSFEDSFAIVASASASAPRVEVDAVEPPPQPVVLTEAVAKPDAANSALPGVSQEQLDQQTAAMVPLAPPPPDSEPLPPLAEATLAEAPPPPASPALPVEEAPPSHDMPEPVAALPPMPPPPPVPEPTALAAVAQAQTFAGATEAAPIQLSTVASSYVESFPSVVANGQTLGAVTMRDFGSGFATLHLGGLLGLFKLRMPPAEYDRLARAQAAGSFLSLDDLRAVGLAVTHDPKSERLTIGLHPLPPAAPAR